MRFKVWTTSVDPMDIPIYASYAYGFTTGGRACLSPTNGWAVQGDAFVLNTSTDKETNRCLVGNYRFINSHVVRIFVRMCSSVEIA